MYFRHCAPPSTPDDQLRMSFPKGTDFVADDQWKLTGALCGALPGVAISRIGALVQRRDGSSLGSVAGNAAWRDAQQRPYARFGNIIVEGRASDLEVLRGEVVEAMGDPQEAYADSLAHIYDARPEAAADPSEQNRLARIFLSHTRHVKLRVTNALGKPQTIECSSRPGEPPVNMCKHAELNLQLASLIGLQLDPYQDIVERAKLRAAEGEVPPSLSWLLPPS